MSQKRITKSYDQEYKAQVVKLAQESGTLKAATELGVLKSTRSYASSSHPTNALTLNEELMWLRKRIKEQDKVIRQLKEKNEFLEDASAFFVASRRKSVKNKE